jgi:hypothetical protein
MRPALRVGFSMVVLSSVAKPYHQRDPHFVAQTSS